MKFPFISSVPSLCIIILLFGCKSEKVFQFEASTIKKLNLSDETQEYLPRMYSTVLNNPYHSELAFSNFTSPLGIVITDYEGKFITKMGEEGRGPGEIQSTRYFGFDDQSNLVILDKTGAFFVYFNRENGKITSYDYPINDGVSVTSRSLEFCNGQWYLGTQFLGQPTLPKIPTIGVFDRTFTLVDSLGGYDPFFNGRSGIMQETEVSVDCEEGLIFTTQSKVPYVQVFSIEKQGLLGRTTEIPPSFKLSETFYSFVSNPRDWIRFLSEEQSLSLHLTHSDRYIYHVFRNEGKIYTQPKNYNDSEYFVAVYDKKSLRYLDEVQVPGAVLGSTKNGELIVLKDELNSEIHFLKIEALQEN